MNVESVAEVLKLYVVRELLDGDGRELTLTTPLLEWGVINSIEIARLVAFIKSEFGASIPGEKVIAANFRDLLSIARLVAIESAESTPAVAARSAQ